MFSSLSRFLKRRNIVHSVTIYSYCSLSYIFDLDLPGKNAKYCTFDSHLFLLFLNIYLRRWFTWKKRIIGEKNERTFFVEWFTLYKFCLNEISPSRKLNEINCNQLFCATDFDPEGATPAPDSSGLLVCYLGPVSYTHLTLPTIYSV